MTALPPPEEKAASVQAMFDRIAPRYDLVNRVLTGRVDQRCRNRLVERLEFGPGDRVLDLACGTGDFIEILRDAGAEAVGLDFSRGMLGGAQKRLGDVQLVQADALRLPFADGSFAGATSGFALRNFLAIPPVLEELARVIRPGGSLGFLEVDRPRNGVIRAGHSFYFDRAVPFLGGLLSRDSTAYSYLPQSTAYLPTARELAAMLSAAGFEQLHKVRHLGGALQSITAVRS